VVIPLFKYLLGDHQHILLVSNKRILTQLVCYGVKSYYYDKIVSTDDTVTDVNEIAREKDM
jgi:pyruvate kinase